MKFQWIKFKLFICLVFNIGLKCECTGNTDTAHREHPDAWYIELCDSYFIISTEEGLAVIETSSKGVFCGKLFYWAIKRRIRIELQDRFIISVARIKGK